MKKFETPVLYTDRFGDWHDCHGDWHDCHGDWWVCNAVPKKHFAVDPTKKIVLCFSHEDPGPGALGWEVGSYLDDLRVDGHYLTDSLERLFRENGVKLGQILYWWIEEIVD